MYACARDAVCPSPFVTSTSYVPAVAIAGTVIFTKLLATFTTVASSPPTVTLKPFPFLNPLPYTRMSFVAFTFPLGLDNFVSASGVVSVLSSM